MHEKQVEPPIRGWNGYPLGFLAATAVTTAAVAAGGTEHPHWTLAALAGTAAAIAAVATLRAALATAALCWALHTGFISGRFGELTITAGSAHAAAVLATAALLAFGIAHGVRRIAPSGGPDDHRDDVPTRLCAAAVGLDGLVDGAVGVGLAAGGRGGGGGAGGVGAVGL